MLSISLDSETDLAGWSRHAADCLARRVSPGEVVWSVGDAAPDLFAAPASAPVEAAPDLDAVFLKVARPVICHRDPERFALLYRLLFRSRDAPGLLGRATDPETARALRMAKAVKRDIHKMHAFVRFRQVPGADPEQFVAWFEPEHFIVAAAAPFFARRFSSMRWCILTPHRSVHWTGSELVFSAGSKRADAPDADALDDLWRTYYAHIFNPARLKVQAMRSEMPRKYWHNLPEARLIAPLIAGAEERARTMVALPPTPPAPFAAAARRQAETGLRTLPLVDGLQGCTRCPIGASATQAVAGEGPTDARIMLIGEQPGDEEDLAGRPFVGPAGRMLDRALAAAGLSRPDLFLTNAVKHFKFERRGKRRIHKRPGAGEIAACGAWLRQELETTNPETIVALGATSARAILGREIRVGEMRGRFITLSAHTELMITVHPAYILRLPSSDQERAFALLVDDLRLVAARRDADAAEQAP